LKESTIHLVLKLRGGFDPRLEALEHISDDPTETKREMDICAGGLIEQSFLKDPGTYKWGDSPIGTLKVRVVDPKEFERLTHSKPPPLPELRDRHDDKWKWRQGEEDDSTIINSLAQALENRKQRGSVGTEQSETSMPSIPDSLLRRQTSNSLAEGKINPGIPSSTLAGPSQKFHQNVHDGVYDQTLSNSITQPSTGLDTVGGGPDEKHRKWLRLLPWPKRSKQTSTGQSLSTKARTQPGFWSFLACWRE